VIALARNDFVGLDDVAGVGSALASRMAARGIDAETLSARIGVPKIVIVLVLDGESWCVRQRDRERLLNFVAGG